MEINHEFIPYEQALALKELGFESPYPIGGFQGGKVFYYEKGELYYDGRPMYSSDYHSGQLLAPLYQQAFRWFREKYNLHSRVFFDGLKELEETDEERYNFDIIEKWTIGKDYFDYSYGFKHLYSSRGVYMTHEEAELECLFKLIEIVKK